MNEVRLKKGNPLVRNVLAGINAGQTTGIQIVHYINSISPKSHLPCVEDINICQRIVSLC